MPNVVKDTLCHSYISMAKNMYLTLFFSLNCLFMCGDLLQNKKKTSTSLI